MGFFDLFKKKHIDNVYHSGSPEARASWAKHQKLVDAQSRVLGQPAGVSQSFQNLASQSGLAYNHRKSTQGTHALRHKGFNQIGLMAVGEIAEMQRTNAPAYDDLADNLTDMHQRLSNDLTKENYNARHEALTAEFLARLPKAEAVRAAQAYADLMTGKDAYQEMSKSLDLHNESLNYASLLKNPEQASKLSARYAQLTETGNRYLELRLGLKRDSLGNSIVGDFGVLIANGGYYQGSFEKTHAPFRDGSLEDTSYGNGSHLVMIGTTLDVLEGREHVDPKHAHKTLNEYFSARQQEMARPQTHAAPTQSSEPTQGKDDDNQPSR